MQVKIFEMDYWQGRPLGMIGEPPIVLNGIYDYGQGWLPFMTGVILTYPPKKPEEPWYVEGDEWFEWEMQRKIWMKRQESWEYVQQFKNDPPMVPSECLQLFDYDGDAQYGQLFLPFREKQQITASWEFQEAQPFWEKDNNGDTLELEIKVDVFGDQEIVDWMKENIQGRFYFKDRRSGFHCSVYFELAKDWLHAKMYWQDQIMVW